MRRVRSAAFVAWTVLAGCASTQPQEAPASSDKVSRPLLLPRELALPEPTEHADARGVAVLRVLLDMQSAEPIARAFFDAIVEEDMRTLTNLIVPTGGQFLSGGLGAATPLEMWRQRFRLYEYGKLRGQSFAHFGEAVLLRRGDYERKDTHVAVDDADVFFRVPVNVPQGQGEPVLGSSVTLLLRRTSAGTKIVAYDEGRNP